MLAVEADFETGQATIGIKAGSELSTEEIIAALDSIGYSGEFVEPTPNK